MGFWPMEGWLDAFGDMGFVTRTSEQLLVTGMPTDRDILATKQASDRRF